MSPLVTGAGRAGLIYTSNFTSSIITATTDPTFSNVSLLLHMDGANNSTTFTDSSSFSRTVTAYGDAKISTDQSKFNGASAYFDGTGDYLQSSIPALGTSFTVECFVRFNSLNGSEQVIFDSRVSEADASGFSFGIGSIGNIYIIANEGNGFVSYPINYTGTLLSPNVWYHIAITHSSGGFKLWRDGVLRDSNGFSFPQSSTTTKIGNRWNASSGWGGYIEELRVKTEVVYTSNFTPPISAFPNS